MTLAALLARLDGVRRCGAGFTARCPAHHDRHPSLTISVTDGGRVLLHCFAGCAFGEILGAAGLSAGELCLDSTARIRARSPADRLREARRLWKRTLPARGTLVEDYLRARGITIQPPPAVRFVPLLPHKEYGWPFPAMVVGAQNADAAFCGVQVTFLAAHGCEKAPVEPERKSYGPVGSAAVRLGPVAERVILAEGVETALSVQQASGIAAWATLGTSGLQRVELPDCVREVIIAADADEAGEKAAQEAAQRFLSEGRRVRIAKPNGAKDFNDMRLLNEKRPNGGNVRAQRAD